MPVPRFNHVFAISSKSCVLRVGLTGYAGSYEDNMYGMDNYGGFNSGFGGMGGGMMTRRGRGMRGMMQSRGRGGGSK